MTKEDVLKEAIGEMRYNLDGNVTKAQLNWALEKYAKQSVESYQQELRAKIEEAIDDANKWPLETNSKASALSRLKWVLSLLPPKSESNEG